MKYIWNMDSKQIWKEGMTTGSIVTAITVGAGLYTQNALTSAAIGGTFLSIMSGLAILSEKIRELEKAMEEA